MCLQGLKEYLACNRYWINICWINEFTICPWEIYLSLWASYLIYMGFLISNIYGLLRELDETIFKCSAQSLNHDKQSKWPSLLNTDDTVVSSAKGAFISINDLWGHQGSLGCWFLKNEGRILLEGKRKGTGLKSARRTSPRLRSLPWKRPWSPSARKHHTPFVFTALWTCAPHICTSEVPHSASLSGPA